MDETSVFWIGGLVAAFVFVDILIVEIRRCVREGRRIAERIGAYADLPILSLLAATPEELNRLERAFAETEALLIRARTALAVLGLGRLRP